MGLDGFIIVKMQLEFFFCSSLDRVNNGNFSIRFFNVNVSVSGTKQIAETISIYR